MARPFDDRISSPCTSSMSSQTSLAIDRTWTMRTDPTAWPASKLSDSAGKPKRGATTNPPPPTIHGGKLAKLKSSPSYGALAISRQASSHGRLHKRGNSASASQIHVTSVIDSTSTKSNVNPLDALTPLNTSLEHCSTAAVNHVSKPRVMMKPLLRKLSAPEPNAIDLSRSLAENEGLGIYTASDIIGTRYSEDAENARYGGYHNRNASDHSYTSTMSAPAHRFGTQYVHPMKQVPRPYTPPMGPSYSNSLEGRTEAVGSLQGSSEANLPNLSREVQSYLSPPTLRAITPALNNPPGSYTHFANLSQTNLPATPSSLRFHTDFIEARDRRLPSARSSLESAFRIRNRAQTDPVAQAATVAALRQKFNEKEAAKDLKYQQADARKREKREEEERRKSEGINRKRAKSNNTASEKSAMDPVAEHDRPSVTVLFGETASGRPSQTRRRPMDQAGAATKAVQSQWSLFWFRCKTMWLKLKRKVSRSST